ncbi:50S ribosomal protein L24 [uncultured archaeon]|nr:50S ribosomal protein L24 [uncultured archaeon]
MKQPTSSQPRKQRVWARDAPLHKKQKMVVSSLSAELRKKYGRRSLPVRKGDVVKVLSGSFKGVSGQVTRVELKTLKVYVAGVTVKKSDNTDVERPLRSSQLQITELELDDAQRREMLERTMKTENAQ